MKSAETWPRCAPDVHPRGHLGDPSGGLLRRYKHKPRYVVLENVVGAPWDKMQSYITGRVPLKTVYAKLGAGKKGGEAAKDEAKEDVELKVEDGALVVVAVPKHVGVRLDAKLLGYVDDDSDDAELSPISAAKVLKKLGIGEKSEGKKKAKVRPPSFHSDGDYGLVYAPHHG